MKKKEYQCRYCGTTAVAKYASICAHCSAKLSLIRKMKKILKVIEQVERSDTE